MTGVRISDMPRVLALRLKHGDWRGLYTRPTSVNPDRYTADARAVLKRADEEVRARGSQTLGTEHLLLALLQVESPRVEASFTAGGISRQRLTGVVESQIPSGTVAWDPPQPLDPGEMPQTPRFVGMTRRVMDTYERAFHLADHPSVDAVDANLLLGALLSDRRCTATLLLRRAGVNVRDVKRASLRSE